MLDRMGIRAACAIAGAIFFQGHIAAGEVLRIGGTGAANQMIRHVGAVFAAETGITLELIPSLGTGGANRALADGVINVSISGRALTPAEAAEGLTVVTELRTPFGMVTSHPNPNGIKSSEIAQIYQSDHPTWTDGTSINIVLRPTNESDSWLLGHTFPGMTAAIAKARNRADLSIAATDQDNADIAEKTPGSLVGATYTQIRMEKRNLRFVAIDGVAPSLETYEQGRYPFDKKLYVVLAMKKSPAAERFVMFLHSQEGIAALREAGVLAGTK